MPEGWTRETLGERIDIKHGYAFGSEFFNDIGKGYRLLTPGHFYEEGGFRELGSKQKYYSGDVPDGYLLRAGDLLVAMTEQAPGLLGSSAVIPRDTLYLHNQRLGLVIPRDRRTDLRFLSHLFNCDYVRREIAAGAGGTKVRHTSPDKIKRVTVLLPPLDEQEKIGHILAICSDEVRTLDQLIRAKIRFKRGLMQLLLTGKRRFREYAEEVWREVRLADVTTELSRRNGYRLHPESVMAVTKADGLVPMRVGTIGADLARYKIVGRDEFAYNPMRLNIGSIARWTRSSDVLVSPDYVVFRCMVEDDKRLFHEGNGWAPTPCLDPDYLDHFRRSRAWEQYVTASGNGSVRVRIYYDDLAQMCLRLPSLAEQRRIAVVLNTLDGEIRLLSQQLTALMQQKKGLMQKLLTGQVRVKVKP